MTTTLDRERSASGAEWSAGDRRRLSLTKWRRRLLRPVVVIPALLVIAAAVWWLTRSSSSSNANTGAIERTVAVTSGPMRQTVSASGTLQPATTQTLNFATSGQVTAVNVKAGQQVTKGTVLATIDSAALQSQVAQAQATVDSAAARVSSDQSSGASSAQLSSDQASLTAAQAQLASAQAALTGASLAAPMDGTIAAVNLTVGQQLSGTGTSGNNISGTGTGSGRTSGGTNSSSSGNGGSGGGGGNGNNGSNNNSSSNSSSSTQIQMISTGTFVVNLGVDDTQIGRIKTGQAATITPSNSPTAGSGGGRGRFFFGEGVTGAQPGQQTTSTTNANDQLGSLNQAQTTTATGTVTSVSAIATSSSGVASFPVVVSVEGSPSGFFAGATVQVAITYNQLDNVLQVPTLAITRSNGQEFVTVTENGKRSQHEVTTGLTSGGQTQITNGLTRGELVVVTVPGRVAGGNGNGGTNNGNRGLNGGGGGFNGGGGPPPGGVFIGGRD